MGASGRTVRAMAAALCVPAAALADPPGNTYTAQIVDPLLPATAASASGSDPLAIRTPESPLMGRGSFNSFWTASAANDYGTVSGTSFAQATSGNSRFTQAAVESRSTISTTDIMFDLLPGAGGGASSVQVQLNLMVTANLATSLGLNDPTPTGVLLRSGIRIITTIGGSTQTATYEIGTEARLGQGTGFLQGLTGGTISGIFQTAPVTVPITANPNDSLLFSVRVETFTMARAVDFGVNTHWARSTAAVAIPMLEETTAFTFRRPSGVPFSIEDSPYTVNSTNLWIVHNRQVPAAGAAGLLALAGLVAVRRRR